MISDFVTLMLIIVLGSRVVHAILDEEKERAVELPRDTIVKLAAETRLEDPRIDEFDLSVDLLRGLIALGPG